MGMDKNNKTFKSKKPYDNKTKADIESSLKDVEKPKYKVVPLKERKAEDVKPAAAKKAPVKKAPVKKAPVKKKK